MAVNPARRRFDAGPVPMGACAALVACVLAGAARAAQTQSALPALAGPVNDFAGVIDSANAAAIDRVIRALRRATGDVIVVATTPTIAPYGDIREYAVRLFENQGRGIGEKGKDNGLLIVVAVADRRVWVEVGYDLEQFITDGLAGEISRQEMVPAFRRGEYGEGLRAAVERIARRIAEGRGVTLTGLPERQAAPPRIAPSPGAVLVFVILMIIVSLALAWAARSSLSPRRRRWGGGPWSGWNSGVGPFGGGGSGGGGFGGGFGGFGGGRSGGGGGGAGW